MTTILVTRSKTKWKNLIIKDGFYELLDTYCCSYAC